MLNQIHIRDLVTIETLDLTLPNQSIMITGETGAGKSIFIEAIDLALGGRASPTLIRAGHDKAEVSLYFDITHFPKVITYLKEHDLDQEENECIIRRVITSDGRSRCYVNGSPSTLQHVKDLGDLLFHLHAQHEQQLLLKQDNQREILDRFGEHLDLYHQVNTLAIKHKALTTEIKKLKEDTLERAKKSDYLRYQLEELSQLNLKVGEWEQLEQEHHQLTHHEDVLRHIQIATDAVSQHDMNNARKQLEAIQTIEPKAIEWLSTLHSIHNQLNDLEAEWQHYLDNTELDSQKLEQLEKRVSSIFDLARKHKVEPSALADLIAHLQTELAMLDQSDAVLENLEAELNTISNDYIKNAALLTQSREKAAATFSKLITETIRSLSLPHGEFNVHLEKDMADFALHGQEKIVFHIKTNPDQLLQPIGKVISGGELSRLSLAVHLALAKQTTIPTLIFDEIDTGLSGKTAEKIGKLLRQLGETYQVFCITHQPQVAALGKHHLLVEKYFIEKTTHTRLRLLNQAEKKEEIARMLGGENITATTRQHAEELVSA